MFEVGRTYDRRSEIHGPYGGQQQGGISTPKNQPLVFLFTGESGEQYGYKDGWANWAAVLCISQRRSAQYQPLQESTTKANLLDCQ